MYLGRVQEATVSRRLIDRYLMLGLACVFGTISLTLMLVWRGTLLQLLAVTVIVPLLVLLAGSYLLRRTMSLHVMIEEQLTSLGRSSGDGIALRPLADSAPLAIGWNTVLRQIEAQGTLSILEKRLSDALSTSDSRRWETVFNTLSDGMAVCDRFGSILIANNALVALLGVNSREQLTGKPILDVIQSAFPATSSKIRELLSTSGPLTSELRRDEDLAAGVWRLCRSPIGNDVFEPGCSLFTIRDITQQRLADEMRNQFVFTATHELRTPLATIKAYAETLAADHEIDIERQKDFYNIINMEATRLARFVDQLLNISQIEAGAISVSRHETDIERMLQEVLEHIQPQIEQKSIRLESKLPAKLPKLRIDKDKITAALVNLLGNAVKYTVEHGQVRLVIEVDSSYIHFHVEDTGIGISPDELPRLCQKFFRSKDPRVQQIGGSGLGLAFSQEIARLHGGRITISSELNKGSRFTLTLPLTS